MLQRNDRIEDAGELLWELTLVLLLAWILTYVCVVRGVKSSGKVSKCQTPEVVSKLFQTICSLAYQLLLLTQETQKFIKTVLNLVCLKDGLRWFNTT